MGLRGSECVIQGRQMLRAVQNDQEHCSAYLFALREKGNMDEGNSWIKRQPRQPRQLLALSMHQCSVTPRLVGVKAVKIDAAHWMGNGAPNNASRDP
jgi:hypothetical protein